MAAAPSTTLLPTRVPDAMQTVELRCFSYVDRRTVLSALLEVMSACGCWIADKRALSSWKMEYVVEAELCIVDDLYSEMVAAGVEFTREAHLAMTWLCTLRRHGPGSYPNFRAVRLRLEMSFLEDFEQEPGLMPRAYA